MSIENPVTYGEHWWAKEVDARKRFADDEEKTLVTHLDGILSLMDGLEGFPAPVAAMLRAVGTDGNFGLSEVAKGSLSQSGSAALTSGLSPFLRALGYAANEKFPSAIIDIQTAALLGQRNKIIPELYQSRLKQQGFGEAEGRLIYEANLPYPEITDWLRYLRWTYKEFNPFDRIRNFYDIPDREYDIWNWLSQNLLSVQDWTTAMQRGYASYDDAHAELTRLGWSPDNAATVLDLSWQQCPPQARVQDGLLNGLSRDQIAERVISTGLQPEQADEYINALLAKPAPQDVIRWRLRTDPQLSTLETDLARIGIHPDYLQVYKTLAYPVPPVGDIITMAVREAFSPEIAGRFGQYEDYPPELTRYAAQNGIDEDWAKRYWAAHWSLPSPQQGFEMLHRGIITEDELRLLLRASDVMPFWRERLIQMSYKPLTRVDVRRMFQRGILNAQEVERAYKDIGYNDENAQRLRDFTVKQVLATQTGFTTTDIVQAYKKSYIDRAEAYSLIADLGVKGENISEILNAAEKQREWQILQERIRAQGNLYKQEFQDKATTMEALRGLRLPTDKIDALLDTWYRESVEQPSIPWTKADTVAFYAAGIITRPRAEKELGIIGYDKEHRTAILQAADMKAQSGK